VDVHCLFGDCSAWDATDVCFALDEMLWDDMHKNG
jgi:hypothetical protein